MIISCIHLPTALYPDFACQWGHAPLAINLIEYKYKIIFEHSRQFHMYTIYLVQYTYGHDWIEYGFHWKQTADALQIISAALGALMNDVSHRHVRPPSTELGWGASDRSPVRECRRRKPGRAERSSDVIALLLPFSGSRCSLSEFVGRNLTLRVNEKCL